MRVAFISQHADMVGGGEYSLLDLMRNLPKEYTIELFAPNEGSFTELVVEQNISVKCIPMPKLGLPTPLALMKWVKYFRKFAPHIIHANNSRAAFYASVAGKLLGIPVVFHCRIAERDGVMDSLLKRLVDVFICNSQAVAKRFEDCAKPVHVIYNGLDAAPQKNIENLLEDVSKYMLFVGRITPEKQVEHALEVFGKLAETDGDLQFVIIGGAGPDGEDYVQEVKRWVAKQLWGERVHWLGHIQDVVPYYADAKLLILTSKHEGFGRVLVESMGQATPVIAYAVGGVPEVFEDGKHGFLIAPNDRKSMVKACHRVLTDDKQRQMMTIEAQKHAQSFSIQKHVKHVIRVYDALISKQS